MIYPNTSYAGCASIDALLIDIECSILKISHSLYNNIVFSLGKIISYSTLIDLFFYRRILMYKKVNPDYAEHYTVENIASRIKLLKIK